MDSVLYIKEIQAMIQMQLMECQSCRINRVCGMRQVEHCIAQGIMFYIKYYSKMSESNKELALKSLQDSAKTKCNAEEQHGR